MSNDNIIQGKDKVLMFRLYEEREKKNATLLALQTKHDKKETSKVDTLTTKDKGNIPVPSEVTTTIDIEAYASNSELNKMLRYSVRNQKPIEVWEIDFTRPAGEGKYYAEYGVGYLSGWETPADVKGASTIKTTLTVSGLLAPGNATVSPVDDLTVKNFFFDTTANSTQEKPLAEYE